MTFTAIAMERSTMLLRTVNPGKPSIFMGHLYHGYVSPNQRVDGQSDRCTGTGLAVYKFKLCTNGFRRPNELRESRRGHKAVGL